jgi:DNA-3-methyladenine glycosylase
VGETTPLPREFYARDALELAPDLLGRWLVREHSEGTVVARIVEVEAYRGRDDPASHAFKGPTPRNRVMFGPPGHLYVYLIYGLHHCANIVCGADGIPHAVLLRAVEVVDGAPLAARRRGLSLPARKGALAGGPGRLGQALAIDRGEDGVNLLTGAVRLTAGEPVAASGVLSGPRVGVDYAGEAAAWPWRFAVAGSPEVSQPRRLLPPGPRE